MNIANIWLLFLQGLGFGLASGIQPGPFQAYLLGRVAAIGWRRALPAALAPLLSDGPIIALILLVLHSAPAWLLRLLGGAGGLFLLFLAWKAYQTWRNFRPAEPSAAGGQQNLLEAALINALGPGPWTFWTLVGGPLLINTWNQGGLAYPAAFLFGFYLAIIGCLLLVILLLGRAAAFGPRLLRALVGLSALALAAFGIYQLIRAVTAG